MYTYIYAYINNIYTHVCNWYIGWDLSCILFAGWYYIYLYVFVYRLHTYVCISLEHYFHFNIFKHPR